jgi:hypothetical protein
MYNSVSKMETATALFVSFCPKLINQTKQTVVEYIQELIYCEADHLPLKLLINPVVSILTDMSTTGSHTHSGKN